jgi:putative copper export protein
MIDWVWLALRAAGFLLALQAAGTVLFLAAFGARLAASGDAVRRAAARIAVAGFLLCVGQYFFEAVHLAGEWTGLTDPALRQLAAASSAGHALLVRAAGLALLALALALAPKRAAWALPGALLTVASFLLTGHTSVHAQHLLLAALLLAHLLLVSFWFGSLSPLRRLTLLEPRQRAAACIAAFSAAAVWLVPIVPLAGLGLGVLLLPNLAALWTPYGRLLCIKVLLFALLMVLAALNRRRYAPALARGKPGAAERFRRCVALEQVLIAVTLAVTAAMTGFYSPTGSEPETSLTAGS